MIRNLRIDDRLLHGQVVFVWSKHLDIEGIIVANDALPHNEMQLLAAKLAVPKHIRLLVRSVDEAIPLINDPRISAMNVMVVTENPVDALRVMQGLDDPKIVERINVGNSGRVDKGDKQKLTKEIYVDDTDLEALRQLTTFGLPFELQMVPTDKKTNMVEILK